MSKIDPATRNAIDRYARERSPQGQMQNTITRAVITGILTAAGVLFVIASLLSLLFL